MILLFAPFYPYYTLMFNSDQKPGKSCLFFTSRDSGRGNIYSVASICLSVCLRSTGWTVGPTDLKFGAHIEDHHNNIISDEFEAQGHRSKVKVTKVKNVKIPVFSLVSEKVVQGQRHEGQGQGSRSKAIGQDHRVKVKVVWGVLYPIDSREVRHAGVFIWNKEIYKGPHPAAGEARLSVF